MVPASQLVSGEGLDFLAWGAFLGLNVNFDTDFSGRPPLTGELGRWLMSDAFGWRPLGGEGRGGGNDRQGKCVLESSGG